MQKKTRIALFSLVLLVLVAAVAILIWLPRPEEIILSPDVIELREDIERAPRTAMTEERPPILLLGIDGVDRDLLYRELRDGQLPGLARLLGVEQNDGGRKFPHAHFYPSLLSELPSSTIPVWVSLFTGVPPGEHGAPGNEFFIRGEERFAAPVPTSFDDPRPLLGTYTDDYVNDLVELPTFYEVLRDEDPSIRLWVALSQVYRGADRLMVARHGVLGDAFSAFLQGGLEDAEFFQVIGALDAEVLQNTAAELEQNALPDVLTVYLFGTDLFAHRSSEGPTPARTQYMRDVLDPAFEELYQALRQRDSWADRYVVVVSDHGHTEVSHTSERALGPDLDDDPPAVLRQGGFRVRPMVYQTGDDDFQSVLAYQGGMAFAYIADRSTCPDEGDQCDWERPPRYEADLLEAAEAFYQADREGRYASKMQDSLDLILVRDPSIDAEGALPFVVYTGQGQTTPLAEYLELSPRPMYAALEQRLTELTTGRFGDRAGDMLLIPHNGTRDRPEDRFYFSTEYHSWHGNPSRRDSEIPLIVAHPDCTAEQLGRLTDDTLGHKPRMHQVMQLLLTLRRGPLCGEE